MRVHPEYIGRRVRWTSQSGGFWKEKEGRIVGICRIGNYPRLRAEADFPHHRIMFDSMSIVTEDTARYFVEVRHGNRKPLLYHPRTERLELLEETS